MQSINITAYRRNGFFGIPIIGNISSFAIKFDTGAANTVVSIEKITGNLSDRQLSDVRRFIEGKRISPKEFRSASGHSFSAYPAYLSDVIIGNCQFDRFYYYLVAEPLYDNRKIALLGDDFIDCCGFSREPHGDILIKEFDFSRYVVRHMTISTDEILSIV